MLKRIGLSLAAALTLIVTGTRLNAVAAPDAVSAASLEVTIAQIKETEVTVNYTFDERAGTRNFCYDVAPATPSSTCVVQTPRALTGSMKVTNLKAGTNYNYALSAIDPTGKHKTSTTRGTFTTLKAAVVSMGSDLREARRLTAQPVIPGIVQSRDILGRHQGVRPIPAAP